MDGVEVSITEEDGELEMDMEHSSSLNTQARNMMSGSGGVRLVKLEAREESLNKPQQHMIKVVSGLGILHEHV